MNTKNLNTDQVRKEFESLYDYEGTRDQNGRYWMDSQNERWNAYLARAQQEHEWRLQQKPTAYRWIENDGIGISPCTKYAEFPPGRIIDAEKLYLNPLEKMGWKLVPIEPTEDMINAAEKKQTEVKVRENDDIGFRTLYSVMLSTAPTP